MPDLTTSADIDAFLAAANDAAARTELGLTALATTTPGANVATALGVAVGSAGAFVVNGGALGTPSSGTISGSFVSGGTFGAVAATNLTGTAAGLTAGAVAVGGITGLGTNVATALAVNANAGGGLIVLADPGADRIPFWDDSAGAYVFLTVGSGLDITGTTLTATGAGATAVTAASAAAGSGLFWVSAGADRSASATDTVATINATTGNITTLKIKDSVDQSHSMSIIVGSNLTADRNLTITTGDASRGITLTGDLAMSGAFNLTFTVTGNTNVTLPTSGTLVATSSFGTSVLTQLGLAADGTDVDAIGFRGTPINSQSAAYTTVMADNGKTILHPTADNNARTFTIAANASVAYEVGTAITFINQINTVTIAINSDTLTLAGAGTTGSRTLAANGIATAVKIASTSWIINGTGLT